VEKETFLATNSCPANQDIAPSYLIWRIGSLLTAAHWYTLLRSKWIHSRLSPGFSKIQFNIVLPSTTGFFTRPCHLHLLFFVPQLCSSAPPILLSLISHSNYTLAQQSAFTNELTRH